MIRNPQDLYTKSFLPSRKLRIILALIVGAAVLVWLVPHVWAWIRTPGTGKTPPEPINPTVITPTDTYLDGDRDGIPDWKEQFMTVYGVEPKDDGPEGEAEALAALDTLSDTQKISLEIAAQVRQGDMSDESISLATRQAVTSYIETMSASLKTYSLYDITIGDTNTLDDQKTYAQNMTVFLKNTTLLSETRMKAITNLYTTDTTNISLEIQSLKREIDDMIKKLLVIPVPSGATSVHLRFVNDLYALYQLLVMPLDAEDPIKIYGVSSLVQKYIIDIKMMPVIFNSYFFVTLDTNFY